LWRRSPRAPEGSLTARRVSTRNRRSELETLANPLHTLQEQFSFAVQLGQHHPTVPNESEAFVRSYESILMVRFIMGTPPSATVVGTAPSPAKRELRSACSEQSDRMAVREGLVGARRVTSGPAGSLSHPESYAIGFHDPEFTFRRSVGQDQGGPPYERARTACLSCLFNRRTTIPAYSAGGYARMLAKSRSRVIRTRPSARDLTAITESSAPVRRSSATVSASNPPPRRIPAHSLGRFSSIFSFKPYVPEEGPPCPRARARQHRPEQPECPAPESKGSCP